MSSAEMEIGHLVDGRYRIDGVLGTGGSGVVYSATDTAASRPVALKILNPPSASTARSGRRFERELRAIANLRDPHTVKLFSYGREGERLFLVFEFVPGRDLAALIKDGERLAPRIVEHVLRQALSSLREAHQQGVLHRDIKPENIRVFDYDSDPWTVKVLDFGLAKRIAADEPAITATGELVGTPRYMSPEQLLGEDVGPASDLYSLGMVAFEMLVGADAARGNSWGDQVDRLQSGHLLAASETESTRLLQVIQRMTARRPEQRFQSAEAVILALDGAAAMPLGPAMATVALSQKENRRWTGWLVGLAVVAATLVFASIGFDSHDPEPPPARRASNAIVRSPTIAEPTEASRPPVVPDDVGVQPPVAEFEPERGCGVEPPFKGRLDELRVVEGLTADQWLTYIPSGYDPDEPHALVVVLHQGFQHIDDLLRTSKLPDVAERNNFVLLGPADDSYRVPWSDDTDADRIRWIVAATKQRLCIDDRRVFLVGHSQGGGLSERIMCQDWVSGVATLSHRAADARSRCPDRPVPFLMLSPTKSGHVPFDGRIRGDCGSFSPKASVADIEAAMRRRNGCEDRKQRGLQYKDSQCWNWECSAAPFESCYLDGGHGWPGSKPRERGTPFRECDGTPADFPLAEHIWGFFETVGVGPPNDQ